MVTLLTESGDGMIADSIVDKSALLTVGRAPGSEEAAEAIETVPSYGVPTSREKSPVLASGQWVRIYPVNFRRLAAAKFHKSR